MFFLRAAVTLVQTIPVPVLQAPGSGHCRSKFPNPCFLSRECQCCSTTLKHVPRWNPASVKELKTVTSRELMYQVRADVGKLGLASCIRPFVLPPFRLFKNVYAMQARQLCCFFFCLKGFALVLLLHWAWAVADNASQVSLRMSALAQKRKVDTECHVFNKT